MSERPIRLHPIERAQPIRPRGAWLSILVFTALCVGVGVASAADGHEVRVLLYSGTDPIRIGDPDVSAEVRLESERELYVPGQGRLRKWSPLGKGPFRVGDRIVRGRIFVRVADGEIQVMNRIGLEAYVGSTVGGEMMSSWPREALRAQAVAARTYALYKAAQRSSADWDLQATTASQVYRGIGMETPETRAATRATAGQILTYEGRPILAVFHSTAGGRTEAAGDVWGEDRPYLKVVEVHDEADAPHTYWRKTMGRADFEALLNHLDLGVGPVEGVEVVGRTRGGRVKHLKLTGGERELVVGPQGLRKIVSSLDLRSKLFEVRETDSGFAFVGSGYGHGVGMSQWGARAMAARGDSYRRILERFYPGAQLETWPLSQAKGPALGRIEWPIVQRSIERGDRDHSQHGSDHGSAIRLVSSHIGRVLDRGGDEAGNGTGEIQ